MNQNDSEDHDCTENVDWKSRSFYNTGKKEAVMIEKGTCVECGTGVRAEWNQTSIEVVDNE